MRGVGWIHVQRPTFTPVVFYDPAGRMIYVPINLYHTPLNAYQPVIPKPPPIYHAVLDNNLLTL